MGKNSPVTAAEASAWDRSPQMRLLPPKTETLRQLGSNTEGRRENGTQGSLGVARTSGF